MDSVYDALFEIQQELDVPKNQWNDFGGYYYRNLEDIQEAVKPILKKHKAILILFDEVVLVGDRNYVKATAKLSVGNESVTGEGYARESFSKKGMDESQITGAASSYARKYALNGLFALDDVKDADNMDNRQKPDQEPQDDKPWYNDFDKDKMGMVEAIKTGKRTPEQIIENLSKNYKLSKKVREEIKGIK